MCQDIVDTDRFVKNKSEYHIFSFTSEVTFPDPFLFNAVMVASKNAIIVTTLCSLARCLEANPASYLRATFLGIAAPCHLGFSDQRYPANCLAPGHMEQSSANLCRAFLQLALSRNALVAVSTCSLCPDWMHPKAGTML